MRHIWYYLASFFREEFNWKYYLTLAIFLGICIYFNYQLNFEDGILRGFSHTPIHSLLVFIYYAIPYYFAALNYAYFYKRFDFVQSIKFWGISLFGISILTMNETFYLHRPIIESFFPVLSEYRFVKKCANNLVSFSIYLVPMVGYWYWVDRKKMPLYGFSNINFDPRPYGIMLLIMIPLIGWASFQPDFLEHYPIYNDFGASTYWETSPIANVVVFEFLYGLDFVTIELFFRGFLIMALAGIMGKAVVMPMVCLYCVFHFGKPMAESISSIFGGLILGIIAYYSRSIYGGICIHLGVAYLMEIAAFVQK